VVLLQELIRRSAADGSQRDLGGRGPCGAGVGTGRTWAVRTWARGRLSSSRSPQPCLEASDSPTTAIRQNRTNRKRGEQESEYFEETVEGHTKIQTRHLGEVLAGHHVQMALEASDVVLNDREVLILHCRADLRAQVSDTES
jgi:hypothetical protein